MFLTFDMSRFSKQDGNQQYDVNLILYYARTQTVTAAKDEQD